MTCLWPSKGADMRHLLPGRYACSGAPRRKTATDNTATHHAFTLGQTKSVRSRARDTRCLACDQYDQGFIQQARGILAA